jgi:hypothetical protein
MLPLAGKVSKYSGCGCWFFASKFIACVYYVFEPCSAHTLTLMIRSGSEFLWHYGHFHGIWKLKAKCFGSNDDDDNDDTPSAGNDMPSGSAKVVQPASAPSLTRGGESDEDEPVSGKTQAAAKRNEAAKAKRAAAAKLKEDNKRQAREHEFDFDDATSANHLVGGNEFIRPPSTFHNLTLFRAKYRRSTRG